MAPGAATREARDAPATGRRNATEAQRLFPNEDHAAVATRVDGQWLILDNRTMALVRDTDVKRAIPEFVLDHEGVKRFNWASRNRRVTS
jgi:hypothetical protein